MSALPNSLQALLQQSESEALPDRRNAPRFALLFQAAKLISQTGETLCVVHDASSDGVRVRHFGHLPDGTFLNFELANGEVFPVQMVWQDETYIGLKFPDEVDLDRLVMLARGGYDRRQLRVNTLLEGMVSTGSAEHCVTVRNISQQGACVDCREDMAIGQELVLETDTIDPTPAKIRWRISTIYGLVFDEPLSCEHLAEIVADTRRHH